jgi:hypothetical protein
VDVEADDGEDVGAIKHTVNKAKRLSHSCKNNGSCPWCRASRLYNSIKKILTSKLMEE